MSYKSTQHVLLRMAVLEESLFSLQSFTKIAKWPYDTAHTFYLNQFVTKYGNSYHIRNAPRNL